MKRQRSCARAASLAAWLLFATAAGAAPVAHPRQAHPPRHATLPKPAAFAPGASGMIVGVDPETGRLGMPTPAQRATLLGLSAIALNHSTDGLVEQRMPDGSVMLDLKGRFREYYVVRMGADGHLVPECLDEPDAILQALIGPPPPPALEER